MNRRSPEQTRARIEEAALTLFASRGFHGTSVPLIAKQAGVSSGALYRHWENKEALVNDLFRSQKQAYILALTSAIEWGASPREIFRVFWTTAASWARANPLAFTFLELHHHEVYLDADNAEREHHILNLARDFLQTTRAAGVTKDIDGDVLAAVVWGMLSRLVQGGCQGTFVLDDELVIQTEAIAWSAIRR